MDTTTAVEERARQGHEVYTRSMLRYYDLGVLGFSARFVWRCPMPRILGLYDRHVTANHLDVGVGTGAFLDRCRWPVSRPRIALMDANENCLEAAARRLARYSPEIHRANVLEPPPRGIAPFDSISLTWLLHCLPGTIATKGTVLRNLATLLNPGGVLFGATLLHDGVRHTWAARRVMRAYNDRGIFTNRDDSLAGLRVVLGELLVDVEIVVVGSGVLFSGRVGPGSPSPRAPSPGPKA